ncbi:MAG: hypothetical protein GY774_14860, partial [Planctomycetes bacterium]|nr:hypothetical protein [Planctomycetota bacterium]
MSKKLIYLTSVVLMLSLAGKGWSDASNPEPEDGYIHEDTWLNLSWEPGDHAVSYNIFIGENYDDVKHGTGGTFQSNREQTFFVIGFPGFTYPDGLVPGTTYYWRIEEVNDLHPDSPWEGDVWSFMITPSKAYAPEPADGARFIDPNVILRWQKGFNAKLHMVYFGDNFEEVNNASAAPPQGTTTYFPGFLELDKTYYWRVDEFDVITTHKGDVWSFTVGAGVPADAVAGTIYVDAINGDDNNDGLTLQTAFATIKSGIDAAEDGEVVLVYPGLYQEEINFMGKSLTVQGVVVSPAGVPVIQNPGDFAVSFDSGEGRDSILKNFIITNSFMGVFITGSSPTLSNLTIVNNKYGIEAYSGSEPDISSCIFWNNTDGDLFEFQARDSWIQKDIQLGPVENLIAYWKFDEEHGSIVYDAAGDNNGTIRGAQRIIGQVRNALNFDGEDDYVELPDNRPVWLPQYDFALSVWVYFERDFVNTSGESEVLLDLNFGASGNPANELGCNIQRRGESGKLCFQMTTTANSDEDLYSNEILPTNTWHHIVAVRDGNVQAIYVNGQLDKSRRCSVDPIDYAGGYDDSRVNLGRFTTNLGAPRYHLKGGMDDVIVFDKALSTEEIRQLYQNGSSGYGLVNDPLFADPENGDYHLRSERGRYWPEHDIWVLDKVTSPCIDGGDPNADYSNEPVPNGGRINMGAYGGTSEASLSPSVQPSPLPDKASNPSPADGAIDVDLNNNLSWTAGFNAISHDVYFGTNRDAVAGADTSQSFTHGIYRGRQSATSYNPFEGFEWSGGPYYWRIDEVSSEGIIVRGDVWTFTAIYLFPPPPPKGRGCFPADTPVWVNGALVQISNVVSGQIIGKANCLAAANLEKLEVHQGTFVCRDIVFESGNRISVVDAHCFMLDSGRWIAAQDLRSGLRLK